MKINKKLELAIKAVSALKNKEGATRTVDLANEIGTTFHFLEQIMRSLRLAGIVTVKRGPGGGYTLSDKNFGLTALDVAKAMGKLTEAFDLGDVSPSNRLRQSIVDAFANTAI